jgi:hypothetical protein
MLLISGVGIFSSCQKDGMVNVSDDITSATAEAFADNESAKMDDIVNIVAYNTTSDVRGLFDQLPACATVTYDTLVTPKSVKIDFGTTPCFSDWDSKYRTGVINISWTGPMKEPGTVKTLTTLDYYVGSSIDQMVKFDFSKTVTNMGLNANGNVHFAIFVPSATITLVDGSIITWTSERDREWIKGIDTADPNDDAFLITGESSGVDNLGQSFLAVITEPLLKNACPFIVSGIKAVTHGPNPTRFIDYGNGDCDNMAVVKVNNSTRVIHL